MLTAQKLPGEPVEMMRLNEQVNTFLGNMLLAFSGVHRMNRYGFCSTSTNSYIGTVSEHRQQRRPGDAKRRARKRAEDAKIRNIFPEYRPHKRRQSKRDRWDTFLMRAYYRKLVFDGELPRKIPR